MGVTGQHVCSLLRCLEDQLRHDACLIKSVELLVRVQKGTLKSYNVVTIAYVLLSLGWPTFTHRKDTDCIKLRNIKQEDRLQALLNLIS